MGLSSHQEIHLHMLVVGAGRLGKGGCLCSIGAAEGVGRKSAQLQLTDWLKYHVERTLNFSTFKICLRL